ncbi:universal stress protein [Parasphingorhabdus cellanae]|uniref:Universal stress protein n=1 Tax=Parasphingorhabdus cellanae TaxID=2806553 RepID=A0ABX7T2G8_9SPHN|nr:universal stress protein [Parasphingorhabdus cellanae]QTD55010.1 universal stress protein [Parasphingorhabdus cellanae]
MSATSDQTIFLTTDLTARGDRPMDRAIQLSKARGAKLVVFHVLEKGRHDSAAVDAAKAEIELDLASYDIEADILIERGDVVSEIIDNATTSNAAMIVTGVARIGRLGDLVMGTQLERIIHHSPLPVLIAKNRATTQYERLVAASDFSTPSAHAIEQGHKLFPKLQAHIINAFHVPFEGFLHSETATEEFRTEQHLLIMKFMEDLKLSSEARSNMTYSVEYGDTCSVVQQALKNRHSDLAVIGTHGTSGFRANMMGSMARALITYLPCDILAVRQPPK